MILFGSLNKKIATERISKQCTNCGARDQLEIHIIFKYCHIIGIPIFPMTKTALSQCVACKHILKDKNMAPSLKSISEEIFSKTSTPIWSYSGLFIFIAAIVFAIWKYMQSEVGIP